MVPLQRVRFRLLLPFEFVHNEIYQGAIRNRMEMETEMETKTLGEISSLFFMMTVLHVDFEY